MAVLAVYARGWGTVGRCAVRNVTLTPSPTCEPQVPLFTGVR